ncbi:MAG TPA: hypothetical protein VHY20_11630, partial [Pirellulales bacterium]|nr:hypothetical protein [Pirellulales bacterium]
DRRSLFRGRSSDGSVEYVPVALAAGLHRVRLYGTLAAPLTLDVRLGNRGLHALDGRLLQRVVGP